MNCLEGAPRPHLPLTLVLREQGRVRVMRTSNTLRGALPRELLGVPEALIPDEKAAPDIRSHTLFPEAQAAAVGQHVRIVPVNNLLSRVKAS